MSERTDAPRSGGRAAQPRSTAGDRGASRDAGTGRGDARGARQSSDRSDKRGSERTASDKRGSERTASDKRGSDKSGSDKRERTGADTRRSGMRSDKARTAGLRVEGDIEVRIEGTAAKRLDTAEATAPEVPRLRVAPPLPIRAPKPTFAAGLIVLVMVGVVGILLINTKTMEQSFQLNALRKNQASLDEQQQELNQQLNQVSSPGNLAAAARRLGLVPADNPAMIRLPDGKIIRTPTPGKGQTSVTAQESLTEGAGTASAPSGTSQNNADPDAAETGTGQ